MRARYHHRTTQRPNYHRQRPSKDLATNACNHHQLGKDLSEKQQPSNPKRLTELNKPIRNPLRTEIHQKLNSKALINNPDMIHCITEDPLVGQRSDSRSQIEVSGSPERQRTSADFDDGGEEDC